MWSVFVSLAAYYAASYKLGRWAREYGIDGLARMLLVGMVAGGAALLAGWCVDALFPGQAIHLFGSPVAPSAAAPNGAPQGADLKEVEAALRSMQK
jgi:hypothetical protein